MKSTELFFERPETLTATAPAEARGLRRDEVRLLVSTSSGPTLYRHQHARFHQLADFLRAGDLLVVNRSRTLPASLPARGKIGDEKRRFIVNFSTHYGDNLWLVEPRHSVAKPGPLPLLPGSQINIAGLRATVVCTHHGLPRLWFVRIDGNVGNVGAVMQQHGTPIRYGYVESVYPLDSYQTIFAQRPAPGDGAVGSAEMPSAARPFTGRVLDSLRAKGVELANIALHTGVSSHEVETEEVEEQTMYAEPFWVPAATASAVNRAKVEGRRVIAVGTTVVRALETAWVEGADGGAIQAAQGFTRLYIHPGRPVRTVDGLISGLHESMASHLAMLYAIADPYLVRSAYDEAIAQGYLWHEFGDSHLILTA